MPRGLPLDGGVSGAWLRCGTRTSARGSGSLYSAGLTWAASATVPSSPTIRYDKKSAPAWAGSWCPARTRGSSSGLSAGASGDECTDTFGECHEPARVKKSARAGYYRPSYGARGADGQLAEKWNNAGRQQLVLLAQHRDER